MNIRHLVHLLAVAETSSFSRAAERLFITQSALSRSIQALEMEVGGRLLDRIGKKNELTPLGRMVAAKARQIVDGTLELQQSVELYQRGDTGTINIGLGSGPGVLFMTPLLRHMAVHFPEVRIKITRGPAELQLLQLRARQLDALVVDARRIVPAPDLMVESLGELRACFACRSDHPLTRYEAVTIPMLRSFPVASTPLSDEIARFMVERYGAEADPSQLVTLQCEDIASLIDVVEESSAVYFGIAAAAQAALEKGNLVELPLKPRLRVGARFAYVGLIGRTEAPLMSRCRQFIIEQLRERQKFK